MTAGSRGSTARPWILVLALLAALVAGSLGYVVFVITAKSRRRSRRRHAVEPDAAVYGAWEEALDRLREADLAPDPASTPLETAARAPSALAATARAPLHRLARAYTAARYGGRTTGTDVADAAWASVDELERTRLGGHPARTLAPPPDSSCARAQAKQR